MRRIFFFLLILISISAEISAQIKIRGTVTNAGGEAVSKVRVFAGEGHLSFSRTDENGEYVIEVAEKATIMKFSAKGMKNIIVPITGKTVDAVMEEMTAEEKEERRKTSVRVKPFTEIGMIVPSSFDSTGFGSADIGYEIEKNNFSSASFKQVLPGINLNPSHQNNINNILAGKIAGLKLNGQAEMALGRTGSVTLRGPDGFSTGEPPVYIVDGTVISDINDIIYSEIEKVTVLNGPTSAALLGSKAFSGAVIITTKQNTEAEEKSEIEINSGIIVSRVSILPAYQNSYAGGNVSDMYRYEYRPGIDPVEWAPLDGKYYHNYDNDCSWGPRMVGQEYIPWYSWYPGTEYTATTAKLLPQPDNIKDFYNTGLTFNNNISFTRSKGDFYVRAVYGNSEIKGMMPNTSFSKNNFSLKTSYNIQKRLKFEADLYFFSRVLNGEFNDNYGNNTTGTFNQWYHRDLDMDMLKELSELRSPAGSYASWNHGNPVHYDPSNILSFYGSMWGFNSFTWMEIADFSQKNNNFLGNISLIYNVFDGIDLKIAYRRQEMMGWSETKIPFHYYSGLQSSYYGYGKGYYGIGNSYSNAGNLEGILHIEKKISDFSLDADMGFDFWSTTMKSSSAHTLNGLIIDELYTLSNSRDQAYNENIRSAEKQRALFLKALTGYRDILFFDMVLRKEYHSTLPSENNSILSKSFGGTFIFSNLISIPFVDFGKIRFAWGVIPESLPVYTYPGVNYTLSNYYWNSNRLSTTPDYYVPSDIIGPVKKETETGFDLGFLEGRVSFSLTWWKQHETGIPVIKTVTNYSGFGTMLINSGGIEKRGMDFSLNLVPLDFDKFAWQSKIIISRLGNYTITKGPWTDDRLVVQDFWGGGTPEMIHSTGHQWGELIGGGMRVDSLGRPLLNSSGLYTSTTKNYGSVIPKLTGGMQNSFQLYKCLVVNINLDFQVGGKFFSLSDMWGTYSGLTERTAALNDKGNPVRDPVIDGGGVHVSGVDQFTLQPVDYYVDAQTYFHSLYNNDIYDFFVYDASYLKVREVSIDYWVPLNKLKLEKYISGATISLYSNNTWMIWAKQHNFDPSELSYISGEQAQFPSSRTFGANLRLIF